jgi:hypothetical protein
MPLTDTRLRTLRPEQGKTERLIADGNGLYIRVRGTGSDVSRTWQVRRRQGAGTSITTLGNYPELSVAEARFKAAELRVKRKLRNDTVEELAKQWLAERIDHTHRKADQVRGYVRGQMLSALLLAPGRATGLSGEDAAVAPCVGSCLKSSWPYFLRVGVGKQPEQEDAAGLEAIAPSTAMRLHSNYCSGAGCGQMLAQASEHAPWCNRTPPVEWSPARQIGVSVSRQPFATDAQ